VSRPLTIALALSLSWLAAAPSAAAGAPPIRLRVDATEASRGILHARLQIPVRAGRLTLHYPKWVPGEHGPTGPVANLAALRLTAGGRAVRWERDPTDMYAILCRVPSGASVLDVTLDYLIAGEGPYSSGASATERLLVLNWNQVLLVPGGRRPEQIQVAAWLQLPEGWEYGTALRTAKESAGLIEFAPVSLVTLVDSPVLAGVHFRRIELPSTPDRPVVLDMAADSEEALEVEPETLAGLERLVAEADLLFGARHYRRYHFLLALSDQVQHFALEHHESSENRLPERALADAKLRRVWVGMLPHEYVHSWNGKHRRPAGLTAGDFQRDQKTGLLWVYEGLTSYLEWVLTARSGLRAPERQLESLAQTAAALDRSPGRSWRPLEDTAVGAQVLLHAPKAWSSWRRGADFFGEGVLLWLEADVLIRQRSNGERSLDDFCRAFFGGRSGPPRVVPYTFDDLVRALNQVAPYDWRGFFTTRLEATGSRAPLGGIEAGGWRLVWSDRPSAYLKARESLGGGADLRFSLGVTLGVDGVLADVIPGSAAAGAGLAPGMRLLAVGGRRYTPGWMRQALREGKNGTEPLEVIAQNGEFVRSYHLEWHGGELYPALARDASRSDLLSRILEPLGSSPDSGAAGEG
jgi:predicted metalloprotease with PDZ domain